MSKEELQPKVQPEVELDTDDVKEEQVELKQSDVENKKDEAPKLNVGEVDLGYTSYDNKEEKDDKPIVEEQVEETQEAAEPVKEEAKTQETQKDNLQEISDSVQKRIDKLTRRYREAERREKAALDYAKSLQKKYSGYDKKVSTADENYLKEFDARVDAQREQVKFNLKAAIEANDADAIMKANDELTRLSVEKEKARLQMEDRQARLKQMEEEEKAQKEQQSQQVPGVEQQQFQQPEPSEKAMAWKEKNTWFGQDKVMTNAAFTIHDDLVAMGIDVESDEYYNEVDKRMKENFPHKFAASEEKPVQPKPVQKVASAGRTQEGRRTVKLTKSQVAIAKKLGVPLEEYAKFVKEGN